MFLFDTGLSPLAFAQTRLSQYATQCGYIVRVSGAIEPWQCDPIENGTIHIQGPDFAGERCAAVMHGEPDAALNALRHWIRARQLLGERASEVSLSPFGTFINSQYDILFLPEWLMKRLAEYKPELSATSWIHPDKTGTSAEVFTAAVCCYVLFCKNMPFNNNDAEALVQDIREGIFIPPQFAAPGLDPSLVNIINDIFSVRESQHSLYDIQKILGESRYSSFFHALSTEEQQLIDRQKESYLKKQSRSVKIKRSFRRNHALISSCAIAVVILSLAAGSFIHDYSKRPTTKGMSAQEVLQTYYESFGSLDHITMDACVTKKNRDKTAKNDINAVSTYYVVVKTRQAYEVNAPPVVIPAQEWVDNGAPDVPSEQLIIFGVSDMDVNVIDADEQDGAVSFRVQYRMWTPDSPEDSDRTDWLISSYTDDVQLTFSKDMWQISAIDRRSNLEDI
ncbi:MAG: hypothetical protein LBQ77_00455 [Treponema sp.]|nr:hypothetical protein [Treponema sp.]